jgi:hypothetical protein
MASTTQASAAIVARKAPPVLSGARRPARPELRHSVAGFQAIFLFTTIDFDEFFGSPAKRGALHFYPKSCTQFLA